jgi:hypothetical protein
MDEDIPPALDESELVRIAASSWRSAPNAWRTARG